MERQKKIILWTLITIGILIMLAGIVIAGLSNGDVIKDNWGKIVGSVASIAPMVIGLIGKFILGLYQNKKQIKNIDKHLKESGIKPLSENKEVHKSSDLKDYFHYRDYHFKVSKNKIIITFQEKNEADNYKELKVALSEFVEKVRKDLSTQLI